MDIWPKYEGKDGFPFKYREDAVSRSKTLQELIENSFGVSMDVKPKGVLSGWMPALNKGGLTIIEIELDPTLYEANLSTDQGLMRASSTDPGNALRHLFKSAREYYLGMIKETDSYAKLFFEDEYSGECISCEEKLPEKRCPQSRRDCGHHCNHSWIHDECCWCGIKFGLS